MRSFDIAGKRFIFQTNKHGHLPEILLICGPCRGGTTALSNTLVVAGVESHMQPMKSILRENAGLEDPTIPNEIHFTDTGLVLIKETFGASSPAEVFNPVRHLIEAGYPAGRIKVIGMVREPVAAMDSWFRLWGSVNPQMFLDAYQMMQKIHTYCQEQGVTYLPYAPEIIRDNHPPSS